MGEKKAQTFQQVNIKASSTLHLHGAAALPIFFVPTGGKKGENSFLYLVFEILSG